MTRLRDRLAYYRREGWRGMVDDLLHLTGLSLTPPGRRFCDYYDRWITR